MSREPRCIEPWKNWKILFNNSQPEIPKSLAPKPDSLWVRFRVRVSQVRWLISSTAKPRYRTAVTPRQAPQVSSLQAAFSISRVRESAEPQVDCRPTAYMQVLVPRPRLPQATTLAPTEGFPAFYQTKSRSNPIPRPRPARFLERFRTQSKCSAL